MRKFLAALLIILMVAIPATAGRYQISQISTVKTDDAAVVTENCVFDGLIVVTDGTNNVTFNIYDNASAASGTKLIPTDLIVLGSSRTFALSYDPPVEAVNGIYVDITTSGTVAYMILYRVK